MKTNYINQLQRDMFLMGNDDDVPIVEDINMEDAANKAFKNHIIGQHDLAQDLFEDGFRVAWGQKNEQLLPIIKELGEALERIKRNYDNQEDLAGLIAKTLLDKYKNYL